MRAIGFDEFGGPEVLTERDIPVPEPSGSQVRIAVKAVGVNPIDWKIRSGAMAFNKQPFPIFLGLEAAGVVDAVGPDVVGVQVGDAVFGDTKGGYAEYALTSAYTRKPVELSWSDAAAIPVSVETANRVLTLLDLKSGETLLVNGASGAVGSMAVQLARAEGVTVIGIGSPANQELIASLGAVPTTYGDGLVARVRELAPNGVDAVFDAAGHGFLAAAMELRGGTERIVTIADPAAFQLGITFSSGADTLKPTALWHKVAEKIMLGEFRLMAPAREFPFADAPAAHRESEHGRSPGKVVLVL